MCGPLLVFFEVNESLLSGPNVPLYNISKKCSRILFGKYQEMDKHFVDKMENNGKLQLYLYLSVLMKSQDSFVIPLDVFHLRSRHLVVTHHRRS